MKKALLVAALLLGAVPAYAHFFYLARTVTLEVRADGSVGALILFDVPKGTSASLIRAGLDTDWSGALSLRERTRGLREWVEVGLRDVRIETLGDASECVFDVTSDLAETLPSDAPFTVAVLYECTPMVRRTDALWRITLGNKTKTRVQVAATPEGSVLSDDPDTLADARKWREWLLLVP